MAENHRQVGPDEFTSPFLFVPMGEPDPAAWKAAHPGWVGFPATLVPGAAPPEAQDGAGPDWANWPKDRWGHRYRPLDEYAPGERAPARVSGTGRRSLRGGDGGDGRSGWDATGVGVRSRGGTKYRGV